MGIYTKLQWKSECRRIGYLPIVFDNGFDLVIVKAENDFPEEAIEPTLRQLSENLNKGSRSGANVRIKIRQLQKIKNGVSKPIIIGETKKLSKWISFCYE